MRTRVACALIVALACAAAAQAATHSGAARTATLHVVRCPTEFGSSYRAKPLRTITVAASPSAVHGLVAYTNTELYLIAPSGERCAGIVAVDGGARIEVWPAHEAKPGQHGRGAGQTLFSDTACVGCKADDACPYYSQFAALLTIPCAGGIPVGERAYGFTTHITQFADPPHVAGSGWPSGGPYTASGVIGVNGSFTQGAVFRSTCTLPSAEEAVCKISLDDVVARYG
jgi:hypothetical protein